MKVVLIGPELEENLSVRYLAAALVRAGHECSIVPFNAGKDMRRVARAVMRRRPDLIGISLVAQRRFADYLKVTEALRRKGFGGHITAGGHFASLRAREILRDVPDIDSILHHDGEGRIVALANILEGGIALPGDLDGVSWRAAGGVIEQRPPVRVADVDTLERPMRRRPDRTLGFRRAPLVSSRGCAGSCSFCSIHAWHEQVRGGRLRFRSPKEVAGEMIALNRELHVRVFIFHDDDFIHPDPREARTRCRAILDAAERGIGAPVAFVIKCRPDDVEEDLFSYLKSKGLVRVYIGIETHSKLGIGTLNRRTTPEANERALGILRNLGVYHCFNLLIFHPDTTIEELKENLAFLSRHCGQPFDIARTELYARSALEDRMVREGRALLDYRGYDYRIADPDAETVFGLFSDILWGRHFEEESIVRRTQDLGFYLSVLERFHPGAAGPELRTRVEALIREVNADTVDHMRRIVNAAQSEPLTSGSLQRAAFVQSMRREVSARIRQQSRKWAALSLELEGRAFIARSRMAALPAAGSWPRVVGRIATAVPYIGLALSSLTCDHKLNPCDPPPPPPRVYHFSSDIEPYLNKNCSAAGCHAAQNPSKGLVLASGQSYDSLVNVPSSQLPSMDRVDADSRDPDSSYLFHKMQGTQLDVGGSGDRMPKGDQGEPDWAFIDKLIHWIGRKSPRD